VDECHRSIYELWAQVLLYFDAFLIGLTATPAGRTIGFFNKNLVMQYGHDEAVADGVNVDFDVWRIRTQITESGATILAAPTDVYVDKRHKLTRAERLEKLQQDLTYTANELDRDVVAEDQIRTVIREFRDSVIPTAFPGRTEVPKTLIFAKDDSHADDIVRMVRDEFHEKNEFCEKITYRTGFTRIAKKVKNDDGTESEVTEWVKTNSLTPDEILANFRNSYYPRIAVTVDMISTGTDVKAIECVFFMRNVKSAGFFEQMKGRGVRIISPDKLKVVTPSARAKERFVIVDAVGVCEQDKTDSHTLNRKPSATLPELLEYVGQGGTDPDALTTLAGRLARLQREFTPAQLKELRELAGGKTFPDLSADLLRACDADAQLDAAKQKFGTPTPTEAQLGEVAEQLAQQAVTPLLKAALRRRILEIRTQNEQTIDRHTIDAVTFSDFDASALEKARVKVKDFRAWIAANRDHLTALQVLYSGTKPLKLSLKDLRQLRDALAAPPLAATPTQLWRAYAILEASKVEDAPSGATRPGEPLADLVSLVRHAIAPSVPLEPYANEVQQKYDDWIAQQQKQGITFTAEQRAWLDHMAEHIATSLAIDPDAFQDGWFGQQGGYGRAYKVFGDKLSWLITELNEGLAA
jgi:type I restriction enzyme R subunit